MQSLSAQPLVLDAASIAKLIPEPAGEDFASKVLWQSDGSAAGVMHARAGAELRSHRHQKSDHHMWIVEGDCRVLGRNVSAGAYVHIPAGMEHSISAGRWGCTFFYMYVEQPTPTSPVRR